MVEQAGARGRRTLGRREDHLQRFLAIRQAPSHVGSATPDVHDLATADAAQRHHRGLVKDDALALHVDEGVGGAEIDGDVVGDDAKERREHGEP